MVFGGVSVAITSLTVPIGAFLLTRALAAKPIRQNGGPRNGADTLATQHEIANVSDAAFAEQFLVTEFAAAQRGRPLTVVVFRIDDLSRLSDMHDGSVEGLLVAASRVIKRCTRTMNYSSRDLARPGTFISVLSDVQPDGAKVFVQKVRKEMTGIRLAGKPIGLSAGVAMFDYSMSDPQDLMKAAESALAHATNQGGNRVGIVASGSQLKPALGQRAG
jgi:GGDEF domain-containing protein